jgi:hypothetical protein
MRNVYASKIFSYWVAAVSSLKHQQVDALLFSLETELERMRAVQQQFVQERSDFQLMIVDLEDEIASLRSVLHKSQVNEAAALANLKQCQLIMTQYDDWQKEFEGFMVTDSAINRLRAHGLKMPPRSPQFVSPAPTPVRVAHAARSNRAHSHSSPERLPLHSPSDAPHLQAPASSGRRTHARRVGGGYDVGAADVGEGL